MDSILWMLLRGSGGDDDRQVTRREGEAGGKVKIIFCHLLSWCWSHTHQSTKMDEFSKSSKRPLTPLIFGKSCWKLSLRVKFISNIKEILQCNLDQEFRKFICFGSLMHPLMTMCVSFWSYDWQHRLGDWLELARLENTPWVEAGQQPLNLSNWDIQEMRMQAFLRWDNQESLHSSLLIFWIEISGIWILEERCQRIWKCEAFIFHSSFQHLILCIIQSIYLHPEAGQVKGLTTEKI